MKKKFIQILFTIILSLLPCKIFSQGLQFYGNEKDFADRSSFRVFMEKQEPAQTHEFKISFEYAAQNIQSPGYIFYLKDKKGNYAYNLSYDNKDSDGYFMLAQEGKKIYATSKLSCKHIHRKWIPISIHLDFKRNKASIDIDTSHIELNDIGSNTNTFSPQLFFGMCEHILETASYFIRNLSVQTDTEKWQFPLNESRGNEVHDSTGKVIGNIVNPVWLINRSYHWKPLLQYYSTTPAGFIMATDKQQFHIYNHDSVLSYDIYQRNIEKRPYAAQSGSFPIRLGMNFYYANDIAYVYELDNEKTFIAQMNVKEQSWHIINKDGINLQLHHHCGIYDSIRNRFIFFGGYGNRKYSQNFFCYNIKQSYWQQLHFSGDSITPRFFAGITVSNDNKYAYIYGGKGNETGDQNAGITYYNDLYQLDLSKQTITKLWDKKHNVNVVPVRDMIVSKDKKYLYLLAYAEYKVQTHLKLFRLSIANGECEALGDSIQLTSEEIATNANLYFNPKLNEFYCVIQEFAKYGETNTRVYSLSNPPVRLADIEYYNKHEASNLNIIFFICGGIIVITSTLFFYRKKWKTLPQNDNTDLEGPLSVSSYIPKAESDIKIETFKIHKNVIRLFGPFTVIDRNERDITYMFSPKIKNLFLFILINSVKQEGVLSADLNHLFWPDKSDDKIKNLKNVTINHLRKVLQELDGIELTHQKGYFKLIVYKECYCDFYKFVQLTENIDMPKLQQEQFAELYSILTYGKFLATTDFPLFDHSKQQIETFVIPLLSGQIKSYYQDKRYAEVIHMCTILSQLDPLSEITMIYTVCTYKQQGNVNKALQAYARFIKEYHNLQGEDYPLLFEQINICHAESN